MYCVVAGAFLLSVSADADSKFEAWKLEHTRTYASPAEESERKAIFAQNLRSIAEKNARETGSAIWGADFHSDLTIDEWKIAMGVRKNGFGDLSQFSATNYQCNFENPTEHPAINVTDDDAVDWVEKGAVTPVKSQGQFGTCGYFSTIAVMEGINVMQGGNELVELSEQENIDCCTSADGCTGWPGQELMWYNIHKYGASTMASYSYKGSSGTCKRSSATQTKATLKERICVGNGPDGNQDSILAKLKTHGPAVWMIGCGDLHSYSGGIISGHGGNPGSYPDYSGIDHATTLVGAGVENGVAYWKVKNSWGSSFGEGGYYRVKRNSNPPELSCPGAIFGVYDGASPSPPSPTPAPTPAPVPPAPTPTPSPGSCHAVSALATDDWCVANCAAGFCPSDLCVCDGVVV